MNNLLIHNVTLLSSPSFQTVPSSVALAIAETSSCIDGIDIVATNVTVYDDVIVPKPCRSNFKYCTDHLKAIYIKSNARDWQWYSLIYSLAGPVVDYLDWPTADYNFLYPLVAKCIRNIRLTNITAVNTLPLSQVSSSCAMLKLLVPISYSRMS